MRRSGRPLELSPKAFDVLVYLIRNRERVISRDELLAKVWNAQSLSISAIATVVVTLPLIVITRGLADEVGPRAQELEAEHRRDHAAMAAQSRRGRQIIAERSGHHVNIEQPEIVVSAVRDMLASLGN